MYQTETIRIRGFLHVGLTELTFKMQRYLNLLQKQFE